MPMGRHKKHNRHLPQGTSLEWGTYYFRGADRKRVNLGRDFADAMRRYGEFFRDTPLTTFGAVLNRYLQQVTPKKAARTQVDERRYIGKLREVFGDMPPRAILPKMVAEMRDWIELKSGPVQANHHLKTIKHVFKKAVEWGVVPANPAREVSRAEVKQRDRYVADVELAKVYAVAPPMVKVAIDLAVLTGQPHFRQHIIATRQGKGYTGHGFSTLSQRAMVKAFPKGQEAERFTFNDLRSKSASDTKDLTEASARLGHTTTSVTKRHYVRKPAVVKPLR
jgi:hypothetical protein